LVSGIIELVVVILLAIGFGWLATRAWRMRNVLVRIVAGVLSTLATLLLAVISILGLVGTYRLYTPHGAPAANVTVQASADQLAAATRHAGGCTACHSSTGNAPLDGGNQNLLAGGPIGALYGPNLTPGGPLKDWTDGEIMRAIREGVDRDGHPLILMPSEAFHNFSDADTLGLIAFLRSQPATSRATPSRDLSVMGMVLVGAGLFPTAEQPHITQPQTAPPPGVTPQYGQYLVDTTGCANCHGPGLRGRPPGGFGPPAGPSLPALVPTWQEAAFISFFRSGVDPYGRSIDTQLMPWQDIGKAYNDDELRAIYAYIRTLS
jgi:mono/diheme cytochrome c family protein